jgi:predicted amidophosphoribosyltransferase
VQPIQIIAETIAMHLNIPYSEKVLAKPTSEQAKDMDKNKKSLHGTVTLLIKPKRICNILLIDDLYSTGSTMSECTRVLKTEELINKIYVLAITKTG